MKMLFGIAAVAIAATSLAIPAIASPWDGTWRADLANYKPPSKIVTRLLANGRYSSTASVPPRDFPADGKFHAVAGDPYADEVMVQAVDKQTVKQATRKGGKEIGHSVMSVDAAGKTLTTAYTDMSAPGGTVTGTNTASRVAAGPPGSHAISGQWKSTGIAKISDNALDVTLKDTGKSLELSTPTGVGYAAAYGGAAVPLKGDPGKVMVTVKRQGANTIVETDSRAGKVINTQTMMLSADGKTLHILIDDKEYGTTSEWTAHKK